MNYNDTDSKMYAARGLRSAADWASRGREIESSVKPRTDTLQRGKTISLYSVDQTKPLHRER